MTVRQFGGNPDIILLDEGTLDTFLSGAWSVCAVLMRTSETDYTNIIGFLAGAGNNRGGMWLSDTGLLQVVCSGLDAQFATLDVPVNKWVYIGIDKVDGDSITARGHLQNLTDAGAMSHANAGGTVNEDSGTITQIVIGGNGDGDYWFTGYMAGLAALIGDTWSDSEHESNAAGFQEMLDNGASGLWPLTQTGTPPAQVTDEVGTADQTNQGSDGTAAAAGQDPPGFDLTIGGGGDATVPLTTIATVTALPATTRALSGTATPAVLATTTTLPATTRALGGTATPAVLATTTALPAAAPSAAAAVAPATVATAVAAPAAAANASSTVAPATVATVTALPAVSVEAGGSATVAPATIATVTTLPAATTSAGATVAPATLAATTTLPAASPSAGSAVALATVATTIGLPAAAATAASVVTPATIATSVSLPLAALAASSTVTPATIATTTTLPLAAVNAVVRDLRLRYGAPAAKWSAGSPQHKWTFGTPDL
jgi:hypothetical protein